MNPNIISCRITPNLLNNWLKDEGLKTELSKLIDIHCLIEYVHRYLFSDFKGLIEDIQKEEITKYCLKGRIFWEYGQIQWRRLSEGEMALLIITDDAKWNNLPEGITITSDHIDTEIVTQRDRNIILWGTYSPDEKAYLELRVSGSKPITYPDKVVKDGKDYPILHVREYLDDKGNVALWRLKGLACKDAEELRFKEWL